MATLIALAQYLASTLFLCKGVQFNIGRQNFAALAQDSYLIVYVKLFTHCLTFDILILSPYNF